jgi:3-oxoadipate enol-lactonase
MPKLQVSSDLEMFYQVDDYTDPWRTPETVLLLHGNAESSTAWYAWVPVLARHYRVVRPDMRGFGDSTAMPRDYPWKLETVIADYLKLMDTLGIERFHLVSAKIGTAVARALAARHPLRVQTLTLIGPSLPLRTDADAIPDLVEEFESKGVEAWARRLMGKRLGSAFPPEGVEWWIKFMGRTALSTQIGFISTISYVDVRADVPKIKCPTLVITTEQSGLASVEATRAWQQTIANSKLMVLPGDSYHVAATHAERCAGETLKFISRGSLLSGSSG